MQVLNMSETIEYIILVEKNYERYGLKRLTGRGNNFFLYTVDTKSFRHFGQLLTKNSMIFSTLHWFSLIKNYNEILMSSSKPQAIYRLPRVVTRTITLPTNLECLKNYHQ